MQPTVTIRAVDAFALEVASDRRRSISAGAGRQAAGARADVDDGPWALLELLPAGCRRPGGALQDF